MAEWVRVRRALQDRRGLGQWVRACGPRQRVRFHMVRLKGGRWTVKRRYWGLCWSRTRDKNNLHRGLAFEYRGLGRWLVQSIRRCGNG